MESKKESITNSTYQSTFLPIFQKAETEIKRLIIYYFWTLKSKKELKERISKIIKMVDEKVDKGLINRKNYIDGLKEKSDKLIKRYYDTMMVSFTGIVALINKNIPKKEYRFLPSYETPKELFELIKKDNGKSALKINLWAEQKGSVLIKDYGKKIKFFIKDLSGEAMTTSEDNKHPISLWQKAELDLRHEHQMQMLSDMKDSGVKLAWLSTHPNCSKRCEIWQGELVSLTEHSKNHPPKVVKDNKINKKDFLVGKVDGINVYSLPDIMAVKDKYGYENNIISGFNCRHKLIPYEKGKKPVQEYNAKDIAKQREIENRIRQMEREIRVLKQKELGYNQINDIRNAKFVHTQVARMTFEYKKFCEKNGYAWYQYRINI